MAALQTPPGPRRVSSGFPFEAQPNDGQPWTPLSSPASSEKGSDTIAENTMTASSNHTQVSDLFTKNRDVLSSAIDTSAELVASLDAFNTEHWAIRYPQELGVREASQQTPSRATPKRSYTSNATINAPNRPSPLRSATVIADPDQDDAPNDTQKEEVPQIQKHPLSILALELQLSQSSHAHPTNLATTLAMLGQDTVAQMVSGRLTAAGKHLAALKVRVEDTSSKVLVTGDLNAGKSTLINAILRRELMPVDQQPCTAVFTEVLDAQTHTNGVEEVHALRQDTLSTYDPLDDKTFARFPLEEMERIAVQDDDDEEEDKPRFDLLKVYVNDARSAGSELSFVTNGIVSIALIDAPGLNRDTLSTTAVFTKQPEIDVVVFVASAENHLTLSAKDFLWNAAREKPNVFVVVNKFAGIRDKKRCMRLVGEQIKQLSPSTWAQRDELVHFVDAQNVFADTTKENDDTFDTLENSLRSFVLHKRASTKLAPARHYLLNLLSDLGTLADENMRVATDELDTALAQLDIVKPVHERLLKERDEAIDAITRVEETNVDGVKDTAWVRLDAAVKQIGRGEICVAKAGTKFHPKVEIFDGPNELPPYPGLLGIWSWAAQVKDTMLRSLEYQVRLAEEAARSVTIKGVDEITTTLADRYLPENQRSLPKERVFRPEVMFAKRRNAFAKMQQHHKPAFIVSAVGLQATRNDTITISVLDLFDFERLFPFKSSPEQKKVDDADIEAAGALSVVSLGVGALTMFGSRAVGVRGFVEAVARTCEILGSPSARKWAGPVIGVMTIGLAVYVVVDLPRAVPRNIGRKLQVALDQAPSQDGLVGQPQSFSQQHAERISRETRKVLRLAGWDLRERCRNALEKSEQERRAVEASRDKSTKALSWLADFTDKLATESSQVASVRLEDGQNVV